MKDESIRRAVIVVHGVRRNADAYFAGAMAAAHEADASDHTLIIAPQFLVEWDVDNFALGDAVPFWGGRTGEGWKDGEDPCRPREIHGQ